MPNDEALYHSLSQIKNPSARAYLVFIFLTGARAKEILGIKKPIKERKGAKLEDRYLVEPLKKSDIEFSDTWMFVNNVPTFKRPGRPMRFFPVKFMNEKEHKYFLLFKEHYDAVKPDQYLWTFSRQYAYRMLKEVNNFHIHFLRSVRATRLAVDYDLDAIALQKYFNWAELAPAAVYAQKNLKDVMKKMDQTK